MLYPIQASDYLECRRKLDALPCGATGFVFADAQGNLWYATKDGIEPLNSPHAD